MRLLCFGIGGEVIADSNHWGEGDMEWHSAVGLLLLVILCDNPNIKPVHLGPIL